MIDEGLSQNKMAKKMGCSQTNIRYWLGRFGLKTKTKHKQHVGTDQYIQSQCQTHGETIFIFEKSRHGYRCRACRSGRVNDLRRAIKSKLVAAAGGKCIKCGYDRCVWALQFDHRDPTTKEREIGHLIRDRKLDAAMEEIKKCDLLCAVCHAETEYERWYIANMGLKLKWLKHPVEARRT